MVLAVRLSLANLFRQTDHVPMKTKKDKFVEWTSTIGYISHGLIYFLMGAFAITAGFTSTDKKDSAGVLEFIVEQPFGKILLLILIAGLLCFIIWRMSQAILNTEKEGWMMRLTYGVIGLTFTGITFLAIQAFFGDAESSDESAESWSSIILSVPLGRWILGVVFLVVLAIGVYQAYFGMTRSFASDLDLGEYSPRARKFILWTCAAGHLTRSILILLIAAYLFRAVWFLDPDEAKGIGGALDTIHDQVFGRWLIALVGLGLIAYSVFTYFCSRHGKIGLPSEQNPEGSSNGSKKE